MTILRTPVILCNAIERGKNKMMKKDECNLQLSGLMESIRAEVHLILS
jgi:hypothetical protein